VFSWGQQIYWTLGGEAHVKPTVLLRLSQRGRKPGAVANFGPMYPPWRRDELRSASIRYSALTGSIGPSPRVMCRNPRAGLSMAPNHSGAQRPDLRGDFANRSPSIAQRRGGVDAPSVGLPQHWYERNAAVGQRQRDEPRNREATSRPARAGTSGDAAAVLVRPARRDHGRAYAERPPSRLRCS
jgi:hypothetical protein